MDNQQATFTKEDIDLAWLGGFIDGDGCFSLHTRTRRETPGSSSRQYQPEVIISNSDPFLIEEASRILKENKIGHWVNWRDNRGRGKTCITKKRMGEIRTAGIKRVQRALTVLIPFVRGKRDQAECLLEFVERRLAIGQYKHNSYNHVDDDLYIRMKELKGKAAPETIRGGRVIADKI